MDLKIVGAMLGVAMIVAGEGAVGGANCSNTDYDEQWGKQPYSGSGPCKLLGYPCCNVTHLSIADAAAPREDHQQSHLR